MARQRQSGDQPPSPDFHHLMLLLLDRKSTRLNSSHANISYDVFCLKKITTTEDGECTSIRTEYEDELASRVGAYPVAAKPRQRPSRCTDNKYRNSTRLNSIHTTISY